MQVRKPYPTGVSDEEWVFVEAIVHDLRTMLSLAQGRNPEPSAMIFDMGGSQKALGVADD